MTIMENPLELPIPNNYTDKIAAFVRDVAFGAANGFWEPTIDEQGGNTRAFGVHTRHEHRDQEQLLKKKWQGNQPSLHLLETFGYLRGTTLTPLAFQLLQRPILPPEV